MYRLVSFAMLLISLHFALAMPDHPASMLMSGELSHEIEQHNDTATNTTTSIDGSDESANDDDDDDDDDDIHVQGKGLMCPDKQPEIAEIEKQCEEECKTMDKGDACMTVESPTTEVFIIEKQSPEAATIRLETVPVSESTNPTDSPTHKHSSRSRVSYYYHCVLKKLELINEAEVPSKAKMEAWIAKNITDVTQREQIQHQLYHCLSQMKDEIEDLESSTESTEETEQSMESASKKQDVLKCDMSKMLVCCLHRVECPILTYP